MGENRLVDAHCHVSTVVNVEKRSCQRYDDGIERCIMSTNPYDWEAVKQISTAATHICFGVHPWYCHLFSVGDRGSKKLHYKSVLQCKDDTQLKMILDVLPEPLDLEVYVQEEWNGSIRCVGEIGLDKLFRLPEDGFFNSSRATLSNIRVQMSHQKAVFERMIDLAVEKGLPVSIHAVKCQGLVFEVCKEKLLHTDTKICLHSYTGSKDSLRLWLSTFPHARIFFSLSSWINLKDLEQGILTIKQIPPACILSETDVQVDLSLIHI